MLTISVISAYSHTEDTEVCWRIYHPAKDWINNDTLIGYIFETLNLI